ncbi:hypothetical protein [Bacillus thuringiensis]|uniref:Uncharacterized protein n=1 Tax=Bacillus thuringiensis TaxID=1428 RepID=A0A9X6Y877_BACTU|nr:hypothetical protein [Bacillus thuringiensis]PEA86928.1 hypothetical protein CON71_26575 [Bacillus thuringiensis]
MKKKLLVTIGALSLSLTNVAPITSFAEISCKDNTKSFTTIQKRDEEAYKFLIEALVCTQSPDILENLMEELNKQHNKLGYLKGDKLTFIMPELHLFEEEIFPNYAASGVIYPSKILMDETKTDPSLKLSINRDTHEVTIEKVKNKNSTGNLSFGAEMFHYLDLLYDDESGNGWDRVYRHGGTTEGFEKDYSFTNFLKAPKLSVDRKQDLPEINLNAKVVPQNSYDVNTSAGKVKAEFKKEPHFSTVGEHTAAIRVWDEYGEENKNDKDHNKTLDVQFNVVDQNTWSDKDLRHWEFQSANKWEIVKDPANSLTDDHAIYSNDSIIAKKKYNLEKGATYKFTTFIKPDILSKTDKIALSLIPENDTSRKKEIFSSNSHDLDKDMDKGFKAISTEFTVGSREENLTFEFFANLEKGIFIDSFKLEKIK